MCLKTNWKQPKVAQWDITCYKAVVRYEYLDGCVDYSGIYSRDKMRYSRYNKVNNFGTEEDNEKKYGFHAFLFKSDAEAEVSYKYNQYCFNYKGFYTTYKGFAKIRFEIKECVIPKGSRYWIGGWMCKGDNSCCAERMIINGIEDRTRYMTDFKSLEEWRNTCYVHPDCQTRLQSMSKYFESNAHRISLLYRKYHKPNVSFFQYQGI